MKYLIFDFDGTIVDNLPQVLDLLRQELTKRNIDMNKYQVEELRQIGVRDFMKKIQISKLELLAIYKSIKINIKAHLEENPPVPGLKEALPILSLKYKLYVFSSNNKTVINSYLKKHNIDKYFTDIFEDDSYFGKEIGLKKVIKNIKIASTEFAYIGDESRDMIAAQKSGMKSVAVTWGFEGDIPLSKTHPDYLLSNPDELLTLKDR